MHSVSSCWFSALRHEQVTYPHDPSSCSHHCFVFATSQVWRVGQMETQHPTDTTDPAQFWCYKCTLLDGVICYLLPANSPLSSYACIRPPGSFHLRSCAALTFCLCLFESRPRRSVGFCKQSSAVLYHPLSVVYQSQDPLPRLLLHRSMWAVTWSRVSYPQCNLSFCISVLFSSLFAWLHSLFHVLSPYPPHTSPLISYSSVLRETFFQSSLWQKPHSTLCNISVTS